MRYPALIDFAGDRIVADFPDCPGCQATAAPDQDVIAAATAAIERWLTACLVDGTLPPKPSAAVVTRDWFEWIEISAELSRKLLLRWAVAKRISRAELARRAGISEQTLADLEDETARPSRVALEGVSRALGVLGGPRPLEPRRDATHARKKTVKKRAAARRR